MGAPREEAPRWGRRLLSERGDAPGQLGLAVGGLVLVDDAPGGGLGVVCDDDGPVSLAGIIGGQGSAVDAEKTTDIYLEAALGRRD